MNDRQTDLEAELASFQPRQLSDRCLRGIDQALSNSVRPSWHLPRRLPLVTALAAACLLVSAGICWRIVARHSGPIIVHAAPVPSQPFATIAAYRQTITRGPGALEALLNQEAAASLRTRPEDSMLRAGSVLYPHLVN